jgi:hypothetical protein
MAQALKGKRKSAKPILLWLPIAVFAVALISGITLIGWSFMLSFDSCAIEPLRDQEELKLAIEHYSATVQQLLTLSVAAASLGAAMLLGLQRAPSLTEARKLLILASTTCFVFSAYFALLWQSGLAQALMNTCPRLITKSALQLPFSAAAYFFLRRPFCYRPRSAFDSL